MIPNNTALITTEGSLGGRRTQMTLDENSLAHLVTVLTDLYSDQELAVIREYATNALDSHVDAGQTRPIEITTPNPLSPYFIIKDFGLGLSVDDIENIYSKYGASTKRESDDVVGTLGLGCKSALTYTNAFTMVSVRNGVKTTVSISRQADGTGVIEIVDTRSTSEPNGVEIRVPVKSYNSFEQKANHFFSFWKPGTVLVNGKQPAPFSHDLKISDDLYVKQGVNYYSPGQSYVVMGNVPYPVDMEHFTVDYAFRAYSFVAYVPIGAVNFPPARESLLYTDRTKSVVNDILDKMKDGLSKSAIEKIKNASSHTEAYRTYLMFKDIVKVQPKYKGKNMPSYNDRITFDGFRFRPGASRYAVDGMSNPAIGTNLMDALWVHGYNTNLDGISATHKRKIRQYMADNGYANREVMVGTKPDSDWLDDITLVDWKDIAAIRLNPSTGSRGGPIRPPQTWDYWKAGSMYVHESSLPKGTLLFCSPREEISLSTLTSNLPSDTVVVLLGKNRWDRFRRDNPSAQHVKDYVKTYVAELAKTITGEFMGYRELDWQHRNILESIKNEKIDDPVVAKAIETMGNDYGVQASNFNKINIIINQVFVRVNHPAPVRINTGLDKYPLANARHGKHTALYINAAYAAGKEN